MNNITYIINSILLHIHDGTKRQNIYMYIKFSPITIKRKDNVCVLFITNHHIIVSSMHTNSQLKSQKSIYKEITISFYKYIVYTSLRDYTSNATHTHLIVQNDTVDADQNGAKPII